MSKYNIGQVLTIKEEIELEGMLGSKRRIRAGTEIYIGADSFAHYMDTTMQPLPKESEVSGYSVNGISEWVYNWLSRNLPLADCLEDYDITEKEFKEHMSDALEELGMWDNTGNRS